MACAKSARTNQKHPTTQNRFRSSLRPPSHPVHLSPFRSPFTFSPSHYIALAFPKPRLEEAASPARKRNRHLESFARAPAPLPWLAPRTREQTKKQSTTQSRFRSGFYPARQNNRIGGSCTSATAKTRDSNAQARNEGGVPFSSRPRPLAHQINLCAIYLECHLAPISSTATPRAGERGACIGPRNSDGRNQVVANNSSGSRMD